MVEYAKTNRAYVKVGLSSVASLITEFVEVPLDRTVCREFHKMDFYGQVAAYKPKTIMCKTKHQQEWGKACCHWTLEQ